MSILSAVTEEKRADEKLEQLGEEMAEVVKPIWHWGDGYGGHVWNKLIKIFKEHDLISEISADDLYQENSRSVRARGLRRRILERDAYRCQICGDWHNLEIDHINPKSNGGTNDPDNLQVLCSSCNSKKGAKIP